MKEDVKIDHEENADDDENDEWVESGNANIEGDTDEEDDEKVLQENKEEEEDIGDKSKDASPSNNADEGPEDNSSNSRKVVTEEEDDEAEETQEDVQIEGDVEDTSVVKVTKDVLLASVHKEDVGDGDGVGNVGGGQEEDNNEDEEPPKRYVKSNVYKHKMSFYNTIFTAFKNNVDFVEFYFLLYALDILVL